MLEGWAPFCSGYLSSMLKQRFNAIISFFKVALSIEETRSLESVGMGPLCLLLGQGHHGSCCQTHPRKWWLKLSLC